MSISSRLWLAALATILILAADTVFVRWAVSFSDEIISERVETRASLSRTQAVLAQLVKAESGQRGFLLTGLDRYLAPYNEALAALPEAFNALKYSTPNAQGMAPRITRLESIAQDKVAEMAQTIAAKRGQGSSDAALQIVLRDRGKELMDRARGTAAEMTAILQTKIDEENADLQRIRKWLFGGMIGGGFLVAICILIITGILVRSVQRPLQRLREGIARISNGDLSQDIEARGRDELNSLGRAFNRMSADLRAERATRTQAEAEVARTDIALKARGVELEQRSRTIDLLGRMANRMPSCTDEAEFIDVIRRYVPQIFPGVAGALYALSNSQTVLRRIADWDDPSGSAVEFTPAECWGLRRGQPHRIVDVGTDVVCSHVDPGNIAGYRCLPLVAQGETVGLLYLEEQRDDAAVDERYLQVLTETVASSLVNLRLRERLRNQSIRDPLTGLFNRRYLEESLELECARADRSKQPLAVVMCDVDHFKRFNDTFGHDAGDIVLKNVGQVLRQILRQGDVACRYGGEEFMLVLPATTGAEACAAAERVRAALMRLDIRHRGQMVGKITMSFGIATYPDIADTLSAILLAADQALYVAKETGRDRVELFKLSPAEEMETTDA